MPQIPVAGPLEPTRMPQINPAAAGGGFQVVENAAGQAARLANYGMQTMEVIQRAEDHVDILKAENSIIAGFNQAKVEFLQRADHQAFTADANKITDEFKKQYESQYGKNPRLWNALGPYLDNQSQAFKYDVELRRLKLLGEDGEAQLYEAKNNTQLLMAQANTPEAREIARNEFDAKVQAFVSSHVITKLFGEQLLDGLDMDAEQTEVIDGLKSTDPRIISRMLDKLDDKKSFPVLRGKSPEWLAKAQAAAEDRLNIMSDKIQKRTDELSVNAAIGNLQKTWTLPDGSINFTFARMQLADPQFQTKFGLVDERGNPQRQRIEQVQTYLKAFEDQTNDAQKQSHDKFERDIGQLYLKGDYSGVLRTLSNPDSPLTGDETRTWTNSIRERQKAIKDENAPVKAAVAIIKANDMIRKGEDPNKIRTFILQDPSMDKQDKEQYLNKLDTKVSGAIEEGRRLGYADIKDIIVPPSRALSLEGMLQTPQQTLAIKKAQMALDAWIDTQVKADKTMSASDIRLQAHQFATQFQPSFKDSSEYLQNEANRISGQMGGKK